MPMFSIIVPVYKTEIFLNECVASILAQTYRDFELILVDDGSPDKCPAMCDAFAKQDVRVKVIHQNNQGVSAARNAGILASCGKYIAFVDSDDTIKNNMLEAVLDCADNKNDMIFIGISTLQNNKLVSESIVDYNLPFLNNWEFFCEVAGNAYIFNKLYRKDFLVNNKLFFESGLPLWEDTLYTLKLILNCNAYSVIPHSLYNYNLTASVASATRVARTDALDVGKIFLLQARNILEQSLFRDKANEFCEKYKKIIILAHFYYLVSPTKELSAAEMRIQFKKIFDSKETKHQLVDAFKANQTSFFERIYLFLINNEQINLLVLYVKIKNMILRQGYKGKAI